MKIHNDKFYLYLEELDADYANLTSLLIRKSAAISEDDLGALDDVISEEQVYVLKTKGFDQHLARFRQQTGYVGEKLSDVIEELPENERESFRALHKRLSASLEEVRVLNEKCRKMAQAKLYGVKRKMQELEKSGSLPRGKAAEPGSGKLSKSI